ncbi:hypothetical protein ACHAWF_017435 [Thalassiosira exigua]
MYQDRPERWPVEIFIVAYRRIENESKKKLETQILVRKSANGTSKYGLGTGVPVTRWILSSEIEPPTGYELSQPTVTFDARNYPEFANGEKSWLYTKIDTRKDAFHWSKALEDNELEEYATNIRDQLRAAFTKEVQSEIEPRTWDLSTSEVVTKILDNPNSVAAIQGSLRMSGLFEKKQGGGGRFVSFKDAPDPADLARSSRIFTMFPQMPCPMPLPSTSPEELRQEIASRGRRMLESGRDPHMDKYGRIYTHISTSNVSNTIHGLYLTFDATNLPGLNHVPALDLLGTTRVEREWVSLSMLKVLASDGETIDKADPKQTFISGFIVRQLVREGLIPV